MKATKTLELIDWLADEVRLKHYGKDTIKSIINISEIEMSGDNELLEKTINEFKSHFSTEHSVWFDIL